MEDLSDDQKEAFMHYIKGSNLFITGPGGVGKTYLIQKMVKWGIENNRNVQVCALTGCAALLLKCNARTVHSWSGIGLAKGDNNRIIDNVMCNREKRNRWRAVDVLIIDEVSMMSKKLFDVLNEIGKQARKCLTQPFGGIQIVFSGDFYQLPPVGNKKEPDTTAFCFESEAWNECMTHTVQLRKIFRQSDSHYATTLNQIRVGKLTKRSFELLKDRVVDYDEDEIMPTRLLPKKKNVELINRDEYNSLDKDKEVEYEATWRICTQLLTKEMKKQLSTFTKSQIEMEAQYIIDNIMPENKYKLCVGANVMCVVNIYDDIKLEIANGSQGVVIDFDSVSNAPIIKFRNGLIKLMPYNEWCSEKIPGLVVRHMPLIYSWAITIHKAQGLTLECAEIDAGSNIFECGQTYVALSRVKSLDGLYLTNLEPSRIKVHRKVKDYYSQIESKKEKKE